ncbi:MAG: 2-oxo-4-hydroxy-4-carboxy-5-ureidoimidazoline decarboxylase [Candidatus Solibacter usitatus]|nr:2-oxo-4-hydroxy-4-carboxy-5-ureidoimidazoline decarboxylase [Candidatus Solibacter usitatus]
MTLGDVNLLDREEFVREIGWVFEHSPWVAERAWRKRPFPSVETLHAAMAAEVAAASGEEQLALLRAHPDLGARAAMSASSENEQAGAGLDSLSPQEFAQLQEANRAYRERFGFPFLLAVKGATKHDIINALAARLGRTPAEEFEEALRQVYRIAEFRLCTTSL